MFYDKDTTFTVLCIGAIGKDVPAERDCMRLERWEGSIGAVTVDETEEWFEFNEIRKYIKLYFNKKSAAQECMSSLHLNECCQTHSEVLNVWIIPSDFAYLRLLVSGVDPSIQSRWVYDICSSFGSVITCLADPPIKPSDVKKNLFQDEFISMQSFLDKLKVKVEAKNYLVIYESRESTFDCYRNLVGEMKKKDLSSDKINFKISRDPGDAIMDQACPRILVISNFPDHYDMEQFKCFTEDYLIKKGRFTDIKLINSLVDNSITLKVEYSSHKIAQNVLKSLNGLKFKQSLTPLQVTYWKPQDPFPKDPQTFTVYSNPFKLSCTFREIKQHGYDMFKGLGKLKIEIKEFGKEGYYRALKKYIMILTFEDTDIADYVVDMMRLQDYEKPMDGIRYFNYFEDERTRISNGYCSKVEYFMVSNYQFYNEPQICYNTNMLDRYEYYPLSFDYYCEHLDDIKLFESNTMDLDVCEPLFHHVPPPLNILCLMNGTKRRDTLRIHLLNKMMRLIIVRCHRILDDNVLKDTVRYIRMISNEEYLIRCVYDDSFDISFMIISILCKVVTNESNWTLSRLGIKRQPQPTSFLDKTELTYWEIHKEELCKKLEVQIDLKSVLSLTDVPVPK